MLNSHRPFLLSLLISTAVFHSAALIFPSLPVQAEEPEDIYFHEHYNTAIQAAKLTGKPIFLEFRCAP
jgi:hypothetical protein